MERAHLRLLFVERNASKEFFGAGKEIAWEEHVDWFESSPGEKLVAVYRGRVVGFVTLKGDFIENVLVLRAYRSFGFGRALIQAVLGQKRGLSKLVVRADNIRARKLYKSLGFKQIGIQGSLLVMEKQ